MGRGETRNLSLGEGVESIVGGEGVESIVGGVGVESIMGGVGVASIVRVVEGSIEEGGHDWRELCKHAISTTANLASSICKRMLLPRLARR